jgi:hypothetical protein
VLHDRSNLGFEAQHLLHFLTQNNFPKWCSLTEGAQNSCGWLTTHARKEGMALALREALRIGRIHYNSQFFSISLGADGAKKRIGNELRNFSVITEASKSHFARSRKTYTGKIGGQQDDVVIAVQLALVAIRTFFESSKYASFAAQKI